MLVAVDGQLAGLLAVADPIRESARGAIDALRSDGLRIVMLTGDNATTANAVARIVGGLDEVRAELKPEDKEQAIAEHKRSEERRVGTECVRPSRSRCAPIK